MSTILLFSSLMQITLSIVAITLLALSGGQMVFHGIALLICPYLGAGLLGTHTAINGANKKAVVALNLVYLSLFTLFLYFEFQSRKPSTQGISIALTCGILCLINSLVTPFSSQPCSIQRITKPRLFISRICQSLNRCTGNVHPESLSAFYISLVSVAFLELNRASYIFAKEVPITGSFGDRIMLMPFTCSYWLWLILAFAFIIVGWRKYLRSYAKSATWLRFITFMILVCASAAMLYGIYITCSIYKQKYQTSNIWLHRDPSHARVA